MTGNGRLLSFATLSLAMTVALPVFTSILERKKEKPSRLQLTSPFILRARVSHTNTLMFKGVWKNVGGLKNFSSLYFRSRVKSHLLLSGPMDTICHAFYRNLTVLLSSQAYGWLFLFYIYLCIFFYILYSFYIY